MGISGLEGRIGIWGAGREGVAALRAIGGEHSRATAVVVHSDEPVAPEEEAHLESEAKLPLTVVGGKSGLEELAGCTTVIRSPGVSIYSEQFIAVAERTEVTTGTNLWFAEHAATPTIVVTGTKGKSTTSALIDHLAKEAGTKSMLAGNLGVPLLELIQPDQQVDLWVLELSSYQIADLRFAPTIGVLLNLYPEHTDWHGSVPTYFSDKARLFEIEPGCEAVLNERDPRVSELGRSLESKGRPVRWFGSSSGFAVKEGELTLEGARLGGLDAFPLRGEHNLVNLSAALTAVAASGTAPTAIAESLASFEPLPHRLQVLGSRDGLLVVDDSISTTPESALAAVRAFSDRPIGLIAGGYDRGQDFSGLAERLLALGNVAAIAALPDNGPRLLAAVEAASGGSPRRPPEMLASADLSEAVRFVTAHTPEGGIVLLSPAAPSYGAFRNFEERGQAFARLTGFID